MKRYASLIIFIFLNFQLFTVFAQNQQVIDSLLNLLETTKEKTIKVDLLNDLCEEYCCSSLKNAEGYGGQALQMAIKISYEKGIADSYRMMGIIHYKKSNNGNALELYEKSLKIAQKIKYKNGISDCLNNIGNVHRNRGNYSKALQEYDKSLKIAEDILYKKGISNSFCNKGTILRLQGNYEEAIEYYLKALKVGKEIEYKKGISDCLRNMGIVFRMQGNYFKALDYYQKALKIDEELGDKRGISILLNTIGNIHFLQDNYQEAFNYYQKALRINEELGDKKEIAKCLNNTGVLRMEQDKYTEALDYFRESLKIKEGIEYSAGIATSLNNIGDVYKKQYKYQKALEYYQRSLKIRIEIGDKYGICYTYHGISEVYFFTKDYTKALDYSLKSQKIASELKLLNRLKYIHKQLSEIYVAKKNYKKAYNNYVLYKELNDSILNVENIKKITGLEFKYEFEKEKQAIELEQQKKDTLLSEEAKQQKIVRNSFISGFTLMVLLVLVVLRSFLQKRKANLILATQKEEIEDKNEKLGQQNEEIATQRDQLNVQHTAITDSIVYAKRIQKAVLPPDAYIDEILPENFILFKPKDVVSGDFYWIRQINDYIVLVAADCTGHGVPGAIMSMLGISFLNEIVQKREITQANQVLNELRKQIKLALRQTGRKGEADDGMDIAMCVLDTKTKSLQYSGAFNPLYLIQNNELSEIKADKMPIGYYPNEKSDFSNHEIQLKKGDIFYLFSDGFRDQFGGKKGFKYRASNFQRILVENHNKPMIIQKEMLEDELKSWMKAYEQTDDILVMGVRV